MTRTRRASQDCRCPKYLDLLARNARLTEEVARLRAKLARQERTAKEQPFGLSTPSPQRLVKPSLPKTRLTNRLLARVAREQSHDGNTTGTVADRLGVPRGTLLNEMHRLATPLRPATDGLRARLRDAAVKHADETPWRTDGNNGYAWVFVAGRITLFACEQTRAMSVPADVLADCGVTLVTDRYAAYNCFAGERGYCFEHLKRDTLALVVENPASRECRTFAETLVPWLCAAMSLRTTCAGDPVTYFVRAARIRREIEAIALAPARYPSVQGIQNIFRENARRLWHWTEDPRVPAENNAAERAIRPLAIARKVSHGSQSARGRETRSVLMSILHTLDACCTDPEERLAKALDHYAQDRNANMFARLFGGLPLYVPTQ